MLETVAAGYPDLETHFVHGALNSATHAMDRHVRSLATTHGRGTVNTFYSEPLEADAAGYSHDHDGFISVSWLKENTPFEQADFYLCGPRPLLQALVGGLSAAGVDRKHIQSRTVRTRRCADRGVNGTGVCDENGLEAH
ncbi:hypothetical protein [Rhizobium grahamii]|nr:hypothetical protein [Rhizobium grahamii]